MNQLKIVSKNGLLVTDSREVAEMVGKQHSHLLRDIKGYIEILAQSKFGFSDFFIESSYQDSTNRNLPCYLLTRKGCDMVANKMTGEKGILFTAAYVTQFEKMETQLKQGYALPGTYKEALLQLVEQVDRNEELQKKLELDKPKVIFADAVSASKTSIVIGDLAKILKQNGYDTGQKRLFQELRNKGYLIKRYGSDYNSPTQRSMEMGLFEVKETAITHSDGHVTISKTTKVTGKGQQYFINKFLGPQQKSS